jgi:hypothetical protein
MRRTIGLGDGDTKLIRDLLIASATMRLTNCGLDSFEGVVMFEPTWKDMLVYGAAFVALWATNASELSWVAVGLFLAGWFIEKEVKRLARLTAELQDRIAILEEGQRPVRPWGQP